MGLITVAKKANQAFAEVKNQYKAGLIDDDQVAARIITLRNKPKLPEELQGDVIEETMDFSPEFLSRYEVQFKANQKSLKERDALIEIIKEDTSKTITEKDATIESQKELIQEKNDENAALRGQLYEIRRKEAEAMQRKKKRINKFRFIWSITWKLLILIAISIFAVYLENKYEIKIILYVLSVVDAVGVFFTLWIALKKDKEKYLGKSDDDSK